MAKLIPREAALSYAAWGWPVSPWRTRGNDKFPLTNRGLKDATVDIAQIDAWWSRWPNAIPAIATGEISGVVALDIDIRPDGSGFDSLEALGIPFHPVAPTTHTLQGGCAVLFRWPGSFVKTCSSKLAAHLDIRGDGGSLILPPGPGRFWDPHLGPQTPLPPMPEWMMIAEPGPTTPIATAAPKPQRISPYAEAALDRAVKAIITAPSGQQHDTLNREVYGIARLVAGGVISPALAIESLRWAGRQLPTFDSRRAWRQKDLDKIVSAAFADGLIHPRRPGL